MHDERKAAELFHSTTVYFWEAFSCAGIAPGLELFEEYHRQRPLADAGLRSRHSPAQHPRFSQRRSSQNTSESATLRRMQVVIGK
jgi:hypothetical protein